MDLLFVWLQTSPVATGALPTVQQYDDTLTVRPGIDLLERRDHNAPTLRAVFGLWSSHAYPLRDSNLPGLARYGMGDNGQEGGLGVFHKVN